MNPHDRTPRTIVITGANAGIGHRAAELIADQGHAVVAVARSPQRGSPAVSEIREATGNSAVTLEIADMADPVSIPGGAGVVESVVLGPGFWSTVDTRA